jgi:hypothetical protein
MTQSIKILFVVFLFLTKSENKQTLDLRTFTMETPDNWKYIQKRGIDSFVGEIAIGKKDTLYFDYGMYSSDLEESFNGGYYHIINNDSIFARDWEVKQLDTINEPVYKFIARGGKDKLQEFKKNMNYFETINGLKAKIVVPKKSRKGMTGIYFESSRIDKKGMKLNIYGYNLKLKNHKAFLEAMKTIKFKN